MTIFVSHRWLALWAIYDSLCESSTTRFVSHPRLALWVTSDSLCESPVTRFISHMWLALRVTCDSLRESPATRFVSHLRFALWVTCDSQNIVRIVFFFFVITISCIFITKFIVFNIKKLKNYELWRTEVIDVNKPFFFF